MTIREYEQKKIWSTLDAILYVKISGCTDLGTCTCEAWVGA